MNQLELQEFHKALSLHVLPNVKRPGRYSVAELHSSPKPWDSADIRVALVFPDTYEIGMSNLGFRIIHDCVNKLPGALCERAFAPWTDMEQLLRDNNLPLFSVDSRIPLAEFDVIAFSLSFELSFTNILTVLDLAGIPLRSADRNDSHPLIIAGGGAIYNPEPIAPFMDAFIIGDGEEIIAEFLETFRRSKADGEKKAKCVENIAAIPGVYAPSHYDVKCEDDGYCVPAPKSESTPRVARRILKNLDDYMIDTPMLPGVEVIHDRLDLEVMRGCVRGCRYCQAGMIYRPRRERSADVLTNYTKRGLALTGYEELSLLSLNTTDYSQMKELIEGIAEECFANRVSVSLPSSRMDSFSESVGKAMRCVRATGLTFAPEVGTDRLRAVINKQMTNEDIMNALRKSFKAGWKRVKFYFMIGLPTETMEDVAAIPALAMRMLDMARVEFKLKRKDVFTFSVSNFIPKPHTPFQWFPMDRVETLREKQKLIRSSIPFGKIKLDFHDVDASFIEGLLSRGDSRVADVIESAWKKGARFDAWKESFRLDAWTEAIAESSCSSDTLVHRPIDAGAQLPWDHIDTGVRKEYTRREYENAINGVMTPDCITGPCSGCGLKCERTEVEK